MVKNCAHCGKAFTAADLPTGSNFKRQKMCGMACANARKKYDHERSIAVMWSQVNKSGHNGCWIWTGSTNSKGYGAFTYKGKPMVAVHRFIYQQANGTIPDGLNCLHKCDVPRCVNPAHLYLGSMKENVADMIARGRANFTFRHKLTPDQVRAIRAEYRRPSRTVSNARELSAKYGVGIGAICGIVAGRNWPDIR